MKRLHPSQIFFYPGYSKERLHLVLLCMSLNFLALSSLCFLAQRVQRQAGYPLQSPRLEDLQHCFTGCLFFQLLGKRHWFSAYRFDIKYLL